MPRTSSSAKRSSAKAINSSSIVVKDEDPQIKQMKGGLHQVAERLLKIQPRHQKLNESLRAIRSQGSRLLGPGSKISQSSKAKLIALYQTAQRQCENEHSTVKQLLKNIQKVREIHLKQKMSDRLTRGSLMVLLAQHASTLPLYIGKIDGHPPALVGAIPQNPGEPIGIGHFVAAYVEDVWILGEIKSQISSNKYLVRDIDDEEEEETAKQLVVLANRIIPLPHYRADPRHHAHALFSKGAIVLALYPQTTCFYKGIVETPPAGPNDDYMIAFEDPTFSTGFSPTLPVPQLYVIMHKEVPKSHHKKKTSLSPADFTDEASRDG